TGPAATGAAPTSNGIVTTHVKLRARATNGAAVVAVIPDNASVGVVACDLWCEVVYKGRRGFIYKDFVGKPRAAQAQPQVAADQDKPKIVKPARMEPSNIGR
ncbi:SH3 domain-containing protein, partial [Rhizobiaceae sp. 2RAB30]